MQCPKCGKPSKSRNLTLPLCTRCYKRAWDAEQRKLPEYNRIKREKQKIRELDPTYKAKKKEWFRQHREKKLAEPGYAERERERVRLWKREAYRALPPEEKAKAVAKSRKFYTGWSPEELQKTFEEQKGMCAICSSKLTPGRYGMCADHFETSHGVRVPSRSVKGAVKHPRRLLCGPCNSGLGHYESGQRSELFRIDAYEKYISAWGG